MFRGVYQEEIQTFEIAEIIRENETMYDQWEKKYHEVQSKLNHHKGLYVEYWILDQFRYHVVKKQDFFQKITQNLPDDFQFARNFLNTLLLLPLFYLQSRLGGFQPKALEYCESKGLKFTIVFMNKGYIII